MNDHDDNPREVLWELIKDIKFAMFTTTHHDNRHLHSRPMTTQNKDIGSDNALWFFMSRAGDPVDDLRTESEVNVSYADPGRDAYVSVSGTARVVDDMAKKKELWNPAAEAWFPDGVADPDLALVRVNISHAHYWDSKDAKIVQLIKMAASAITGNPSKDMVRQGEVRM